MSLKKLGITGFCPHSPSLNSPWFLDSMKIYSHIDDTSQPSSLVSSLFPNEIWDEITSYFCHKRSALNLQRTSSTLHSIVSRRIYRDVDISDLSARRFMKTLIESNHDYGDYTRRFVYRSTSNSDGYLTYPLLAKALHCLNRLESLTFHIPPDLTSFLFDLLHASCAIYPFAYGQTHRVITSLRKKPSIPRLPCLNLRELNIYGDIRLVEFATYRSLSSISISIPMDESHLTHFLDATTNFTGINETINTLALTFSNSVGGAIANSLWTIGFGFKALQHIFLRAPAVNALEASATLSLSPPIFPNLESFSLNAGNIVETVNTYTESVALKLQHEHLISAGRLRPHFMNATFGTKTWSKDITQDQERWYLKHQCTMAPKSYYDDYIGFYGPLFWDVYYCPLQPFVLHGVNMFVTDV